VSNSNQAQRLAKHKLTEGNIRQHLTRMTIPMIGGILSIMSMNIVDTYYIGQLGTIPLTAMSFTLPILSTLLSIAFGIGIGTSSVISRAIGANEHTLVQSYCTQSIFIALFIAIIFAMTGYFYMDTIFTALGAPKELFHLIHDYMDIWFLGSFVVVIPMVGNSAIRASGNAKLPALVMLSVAIVNMILDPILIFGLFGFPAMGLAGAALATVISYSIALFLGLYFLAFKFNYISLNACYKSAYSSWKTILKIAVPSIGTNLIPPISIAITTWFVANNSPEAVAGFGVASRIEAIFLVVIMGLSSITGPFVGQNWGAQKYDRVFTALSMNFRFISLWALFTTILLWVFGQSISELFSNDPVVISSSIQYLSIVPCSYLFLGIIMVCSAMANGMGRPTPSLIMSFLRLIAIYIPLAYLLMDMFGLSGIYASTALANIIVGLGAFIWYRKIKGKKTNEHRYGKS